MAIEVYSFAVAVAPGTVPATPQTTALTMPMREVVAVHLRVPPGPRGEVGFALGAAGVAILPTTRGTWLVLDDERIDWPLERQITSGAWQMLAYNTGTYAHTVYVRFECNLTAQLAAQAGPDPFDIATLRSGRFAIA